LVNHGGAKAPPSLERDMTHISHFFVDIMANWPMQTILERREQIIEALGRHTYEAIIKKKTAK